MIAGRLEKKKRLNQVNHIAGSIVTMLMSRSSGLGGFNWIYIVCFDVFLVCVNIWLTIPLIASCTDF